MLDFPRHGFRPEEFTSATGPSIPRTKLDIDNATRHGPEGRVLLFRDVQSNYLDLPRNIFVYLPPGYVGDGDLTFMTDGGALCDSLVGLGGPPVKLGVDTTCDEFIRSGMIRPQVIVGIFSTRNRGSEYLPELNAENLGHCIVRELKPQIEELFHTRRDPESTGIMGTSFGGRAALGIAAMNPGVFGKIGSMSGSLGADNGAATDHLAWRFREAGFFPSRIWLCTGAGEETAKHIGRLETELSQLGWRDEKDLKAIILKDGEHNEASWRWRFRYMIQYLFADCRTENKALGLAA